MPRRASCGSSSKAPAPAPLTPPMPPHGCAASMTRSVQWCNNPSSKRTRRTTTSIAKAPRGGFSSGMGAGGVFGQAARMASGALAKLRAEGHPTQGHNKSCLLPLVHMAKLCAKAQPAQRSRFVPLSLQAPCPGAMGGGGAPPGPSAADAVVPDRRRDQGQRCEETFGPPECWHAGLGQKT